MQQHLPSGPDGLLRYDMGAGVTAFSPLREAALPFPVLQAHQVHSDHVAVVTSPAITREDLQGTDAIVTTLPGLAVAARTADCIPVLLYDPVGRAVAAVHAGWKGTVQSIAAKTVRAMAETFGTRPEDCLAGIGPSIGACCYEVGDDVAGKFREAFPQFADEVVLEQNGTLRLDLWKANRLQLEASGLTPNHIDAAGVCTACHARTFFSYRAEGPTTGRIAAVMAIQ